MKKILFLLILSLLLGICSSCQNSQKTDPTQESSLPDTSSQQTQDSGSTGQAQDSGSTGQTQLVWEDADMFTDRDSRTGYDEAGAVSVLLTGNGAEASSETVRISGSTVTLTQEATYIISGSLTDGMLIVDAPDSAKLQLVFRGAEISSSTSAALYIKNADKVFLTLDDGSVNSLSNGGSFTAIDENNIDGAVFSKQDLTVNGSGSLTVTSPAGHGIVCKDDLVITGGSITANAASHAIDANDSLRLTGASLTLDAGKDAIHIENSENTEKGFVYISGGSIVAEAEGDGISASAYILVSGGSVSLLTGGGAENGTKSSSDSFGGFMGGRPGGFSGQQEQTEDSTSMKGLKADGDIRICGGEFSVNSADDSIHANASVTVTGGSFTLSSGDDGIHAEDTLTVSGGKISILESYEGLEALHILVQDGQISLVTSDDGLNAAGGTDQSGTEGGRDGMFGGFGHGGMGGPGGMSTNSNGSIVISGGTLSINSSGDGIDANGTLEITGGHTTVVGPTRGDTATLDYDKSAVISGGTFIGTGASGMAQTFSDSSQGVIAVSVGNQSAGTQILLTDSSAETVLSHAPELDFAVVILSSPDIRKGESYTITVGETSGEFEAQ